MRIAAIRAPSERQQNRRTPPALFRELALRFGRGGFDLDAAADETNALCPMYWTAEDDALSDACPWFGRVFVNPPYAEIAPWVWKAHCEVAMGRADVVVMLVPARIGSSWFDEYAKPLASRIEPIVGRVQFEDKQPFEGSLVLVFERPLRAEDFR